MALRKVCNLNIIKGLNVMNILKLCMSKFQNEARYNLTEFIENETMTREYWIMSHVNSTMSYQAFYYHTNRNSLLLSPHTPKFPQLLMPRLTIYFLFLQMNVYLVYVLYKQNDIICGLLYWATLLGIIMFVGLIHIAHRTFDGFSSKPCKYPNNNQNLAISNLFFLV